MMVSHPVSPDHLNILQRSVIRRLNTEQQRLHHALASARDIDRRTLARLETEIDRQHALIHVALAGGIPPEWIAAIQQGADQGAPVRELSELPTGHVDRADLVARVTHDVATLRTITGLDARYGPAGLAENRQAARRLHTVMRDRRADALIVTKLLGLEPEETREIWTSDPGAWETDAAARVAGLDPAVVRARWYDAADTDTSGLRRRTAAAASAGVHPATDVPVTTQPTDLVRGTRTRLDRSAIIHRWRNPTPDTASTALRDAGLTGTQERDLFADEAAEPATGVEHATPGPDPDPIGGPQ
ncbi:hypothetical protein IU487_31520 [Nocardia puris]|nr:hypothetical protein [Nocardia puris]MBF6215527.1 hypothetical protein [Nocardia puris]